MPDWELGVAFEPLQAIAGLRSNATWVNYKGEEVQPSPLAPAAEFVAASDKVPFDLASLPLRNPDTFVSGGLQGNFEAWQDIGASDNVLGWVKNGMDIEEFFQHFRGDFKGRTYDSDRPPPMVFQNSPSCALFEDFVTTTLLDRIKNGSLRVWGKVGECEPPHLVMPLTVEPSKPRLCHDERFLNLWICDSPFSLDTLKEVPRVVQRDMFLTSVDDKSGYDHVRVSENSQTYFGISFAGWFLVYTVIPFGYKASAFVYHTTGLAATSYCRKLGVPCLQYIDDRMLAELGYQCGTLENRVVGGKDRALRALYVVCWVLTRLGYTLGLAKCKFEPSQVLLFLGFLTDSTLLTFSLPAVKKERFASLRDQILSSGKVDVKMLQRFAGKCVSFVLAVPAARLYTREVNLGISRGIRSSRQVSVVGKLREEILHWKFLDTWSGGVVWRSEKHLQITMMTDASLYKWGGVVDFPVPVVCGDFWENNDHRPIHIKEGLALVNTLKALSTSVMDHRVDAFVDNMALVSAWHGQGGRNSQLTDVIKELFQVTMVSNIDLKIAYVPSAANAADDVSRSFSKQDAMLAGTPWLVLQGKFGPHTVDLMSLDSNVMRDGAGVPLRHFSPFPTPFSAGVNIFSQDISVEKNPYVFPPFCMVAPVLRYLQLQRIQGCTMVVPYLYPVPFWWPLLQQHVVDQVCLGRVGNVDTLLYPSKQGFSSDKRGLPWDVYGFRLKF